MFCYYFRKNWSLAYVVAYGSNLLIYKDEKAAAAVSISTLYYVLLVSQVLQ